MISPRDRRKVSTQKVALWLAGVVLVGGLLLWTPLLSGIGAVVNLLSYPVIHAGSSFQASVGLYVESLRDSKANAEEVQRLEEELRRLSVKLLDRDLLFDENIRLKRLLDIGSASSTIARIIARPPRTPYDTLLVDKGVADGVVKGDTVLIEDSYIGIVDATVSNGSRVRLVSTPESTTSILITPTGPTIDALGLGSGSFIMELQRDIPIEVGDVLYSEAVGPYSVGTVIKIDEDQNNPFKQVYCQTHFDVQYMTYVRIQHDQTYVENLLQSDS